MTEEAQVQHEQVLSQTLHDMIQAGLSKSMQLLYMRVLSQFTCAQHLAVWSTHITLCLLAQLPRNPACMFSTLRSYWTCSWVDERVLTLHTCITPCAMYLAYCLADTASVQCSLFSFVN